MFAVCFLHQTQPVKLRGALTGVWLGAKNEEEMNYMAPSHSPADSISAESQPHGHVCERSTHKYLPPPPLTPPQRGLSDGDGERMSLSGWLSAAGPGPGHIPALWAQVGGLPLSAGLKGRAWRRAATERQDVPLLLSLTHKNNQVYCNRLLTECIVEGIKLAECVLLCF